MATYRAANVRSDEETAAKREEDRRSHMDAQFYNLLIQIFLGVGMITFLVLFLWSYVSWQDLKNSPPQATVAHPCDGHVQVSATDHAVMGACIGFHPDLGLFAVGDASSCRNECDKHLHAMHLQQDHHLEHNVFRSEEGDTTSSDSSSRRRLSFEGWLKGMENKHPLLQAVHSKLHAITSYKREEADKVSALISTRVSNVRAVAEVLKNPEGRICGNYAGGGWCSGQHVDENVCDRSAPPTCPIDNCAKEHDGCCKRGETSAITTQSVAAFKQCNPDIVTCVRRASSSPPCRTGAGYDMPGSIVADAMAVESAVGHCCSGACPSVHA